MDTYVDAATFCLTGTVAQKHFAGDATKLAEYRANTANALTAYMRKLTGE
jgi:hypothetical protein